MRDMNRVTLVGRLGKDPIERETKTGKKVVHFSVATSHSSASEEKSAPVWHQIVAWGKLAEISSRMLRKGCAVFVEGRIINRQYEGKDGTQNRTYEIWMDELNVLSFPKDPRDHQDQHSRPTLDVVASIA